MAIACLFKTGMKLTYYIGLQYAALYFSLVYYWVMIFMIANGHIRNAKNNNQDFFFVENYLHFLIFAEIIVFFANLATYILILFFASCASAKK
jgi:hypothetical protein